MVGRFVEDEEVHRLEQELDHGQAGALTTTEYLHLLVRCLAAEHKGTQDVAYLQTDVAHSHAVDGVEHRQLAVQQLRLVLREVAYLYVVSQRQFTRVVGNFAHDTLYQRRLTFAVLAHEGHLLATVDGEVDVVENYVVAIGFRHILANDRIVATTAGADKLQAQGGVVFLVHLDAFDFLQLLDATLHLHGLGSLVAETLDEGFSVLDLLLLVLVGTELLLAAFLAQDDKLVVLHLVVVDASAGYFDGAGRDVVQEGTVVADQHHGIGARGEEVLQPLDGLDVQVVGRLVQQQYVRAAEQQLGQLDAHAPSTRKLACGAVEVRTAEAQALERALYLGLIVGASHHQKAVVLVREAVDELLIVLTLVVGTVGQFLVHALDVGLHLEDVFEGQLGFLHHRPLVAQHHHLRQVADGTFTWDGYHTRRGVLQSGQYLQHGRFARPVLAHQGDAVFFVDDVRHVFEQGRGVEFHFQSFYRYHRVNVFFRLSLQR